MKEKHECGKCGKKFDSESSLNQHDKGKHSAEIVGMRLHPKTLAVYALIVLVAALHKY